MNAAASDLRVFNATPSDFATLPVNGSLLTWSGNSYTVIFAVTSDMNGAAVSLKIFAFRTPPPDSAGDETPAEAVAANEPAAAGKRKQYAPPPSTL